MQSTLHNWKLNVLCCWQAAAGARDTPSWIWRNFARLQRNSRQKSSDGGSGSVKVFDSFSVIIVSESTVLATCQRSSSNLSRELTKNHFWAKTIVGSLSCFVISCEIRMQQFNNRSFHRRVSPKKQFKLAKTLETLLERPSTALQRPLHSIETVASELETKNGSGEF